MIFDSSTSAGNEWLLELLLPIGRYSVHAIALAPGDGSSARFDVSIAAVPEPGTALLLGFGMLLLTWQRREAGAGFA